MKRFTMGLSILASVFLFSAAVTASASTPPPISKDGAFDIQKGKLSGMLKELQKIEAAVTAEYGADMFVGLKNVEVMRTADEVADVADLATEVSIRLYRYRCFTRLSDSEALKIRNIEVSLDSWANYLRALGLAAVMSVGPDYALPQ